MSQKFYYGIESFGKVLRELGAEKFLLVCDASYDFLNIKDIIKSVGIPFVRFDSFTPNPLHDDADKGRKIFEEEEIRVIVAVGGGSSMDVAKCIKLDSEKPAVIIAIPTTAGTGAESTRYIVVYRDGKKESLGDPSVIPEIVIFEPDVLKTLPVYQKKCTMLDAFCQAIESLWSVNATEESRPLSKEAMRLIVANRRAYIEHNDEDAARNIMRAANLAGQAINITQTTAAHAMSYKITSSYGIPHGNAVAICLPEVWESMLKDSTLSGTFREIARELGQETPEKAILWFREMLSEYEMKYPEAKDFDVELQMLTDAVNPVRLKNNPVQFTPEELKEMYKRILK